MLTMVEVLVEGPAKASNHKTPSLAVARDKCCCNRLKTQRLGRRWTASSLKVRVTRVLQHSLYGEIELVHETRVYATGGIGLGHF